MNMLARTLFRHLRFEPLEDRRLLAITVDTLLDEFDGVGVGAGTSLREAIFAAGAGDTINFSVTGAIELSSLGELTINKNLVIDGPGADLITIRAHDPTPTIKNGDGSRIFNIDNGNDGMQFTSTLTGLTLTGGDVSGAGGAINAREFLTIVNCVVSDNAASGMGGGIFQAAPSFLSIIGSTVSRNTSNSHGGGIAKQSIGRLSVANSTISGNTADTGSGGGIYAGIYTYGADFTHATISNNSAHSGGGLFADSRVELTLDHSIVAGNSASHAGPDVRRYAGAISLNYTLVGDNSGTSLLPAPVGSPDANGNLIGTATVPINPQLAPLANNGGPTMTHALLPGSPARDAGDPTALAAIADVPQFDQRGAPFTRVAGGRIDMGAFETQIVVDTFADENDGDHSRGDLSLREAIGLANADPGSDLIRFDPDLFASGPGTIILTMGALVVSTSLSIEGPGAELLSIDASGNDPTPDMNNGDGTRVFEVTNNVSISGLTLTGGDAAAGGGAIRNAGELSLSECIITSNAANGGGGIENRFGGTLTLADSTVSGNFAVPAMSANGGGIYSSGTLSVVRSIISGNSARTGAGIHIADGSATVSDSTIWNNTATFFGAGVRVLQGSMVITNTTISGNSALNDRAGGIYSSGSLTLINSTITGNTASHRAAGI